MQPQTIEEYKTYLTKKLRLVENGLGIEMEQGLTSEGKLHKECEANTIGAIASAIDYDEDLLSVFDIPTCSIIMIKRIKTANNSPLIADTQRMIDGGKTVCETLTIDESEQYIYIPESSDPLIIREMANETTPAQVV